MDVLSFLAKSRDKQPGRVLGLFQWLSACALFASAYGIPWCADSNDTAFHFAMILGGVGIAFLGCSNYFPRAYDDKRTFGDLSLEFFLNSCVLVMIASVLVLHQRACVP
jgi:hypothetical protein